ncbi:heme-binding protein 1-like [Penaeus japonicus]|uniref:heme-binding protein 1-like n=1 Tax=Penaeus japonicus TaxID=27405 RepID=UPI001C7111C7|nr:heme-binding protein 1-like [Penaeus japonicus]
MKTTTIVIGVLMIVQLSAAQYETENLEYVSYVVTRTADSYEERLYEASKWACHDLLKDTYGFKAQRESFMPLFRYITGDNVEGAEINMTGSVTIRKDVLPDLGKRYQMCFYMPAAHQAAPPAPTNPDVYIEDRPPMTILTRVFGGFAMRESVWEEEAATLKQILQDAGETDIDYSLHYRLQYDPPMKFENRRNELWYVKKK